MLSSRVLRAWAALLVLVSLSGWSLWGALDAGADSYGTLAMLVVSFAALELVPLMLPRGELFRMSGGVSSAALALVAPPTAVASFLMGATLGQLLKTQGGPALGQVEDLARRGALLAAVAAAYALTTANRALSAVDPQSVATAFAAGCAYLMLDMWSYVVLAPPVAGDPTARATLGLVRLLGSVYLGQVSVGVVLALVHPRLGVLAFVILVILMLIMQHTSGLLLKVRGAYMKTVGALVRLAEAQRPHAEGHAERVASLAAAMGRTLGLGQDALERLTLAALLHDIGMVALGEDAETYDPEAVANAGVTLVSKVSFLTSLGPVILRQSETYFPGPLGDDVDVLLARILRVASDFDDALHTRGHAAALEEIESEQGILYDPRVVAVLHDCVRGAQDGAA